MRKLSGLGGIFSFVMMSSAWGQNLQLGTPVMGGSGCAAGTSSVSISSDQSVLSVLYSAFSLEAEAQSQENASCTLIIPIKVPDGYSLKVLSVDYRGFVSLPYASAHAELITKHAFLNRRARRGAHADSRRFGGPLEKDFFDTQSIRNAWSSDCGAETEIQLETKLIVRNRGNPRRGEVALITLDSLDSDGAGMKYQMKLRRCN